MPGTAAMVIGGSHFAVRMVPQRSSGSNGGSGAAVTSNKETKAKTVAFRRKDPVRIPVTFAFMIFADLAVIG